MSEPEAPIERINRNKRVQQKRDLATRETVIRALMGQKDGRRFVWLELEEASVFSQTFVPGQPEITAFQEGKRSIGLRLLGEVTRLTPADYMRMTQENAAVAIAIETGDSNENV